MSSEPKPKQALFEQLALVARGFGSPARLELLDYLAQAERSVEELARISGLSIANTSKHLQQLRHAGLVEVRREGLHGYYSVSGEDVLKAVTALRTLAESRLAEVDRLINVYLSGKDELEPVARGELMTRADNGLVTVVDVRPAEEYVQGHLQGAINIPLSKLRTHLGRLPKGREVVAYCRGPWCDLSFEAVALLRAEGYEARRMEGGLPEWRQEGRPLTLS